jgi:hypothetical protein
MPDTISLTHDGLVYLTDRAALFNFDGDQRWIPLSLIDDAEDLDPEILNEPGEVIVPLWFARKEGLEQYES